jgi:hypothetical protein
MLPAKVQCPGCGIKFQVAANGQATPLAPAGPVSPLAAGPAPGVQPTVPAPAHYIPPFPADVPASGANVPLLIGLISGAVLFVGVGIGLAVYLMGREDEKQTTTRKQETQEPPRDVAWQKPPVPLVQQKPVENGPARPVQVPVNPQPVQPKPPIDPVKPLPKEEQDRVDKAIERGVAYLKAALDDASPTGKDSVVTVVGPVDIKHPGAMALTGLTLLACGVPATDPSVVKVINRIRQDGPQMTNTYVLSLSILFLDRLAAAEDQKLIRSMALRLVAGQNARGAWCYACPQISAENQENLLKVLQALASNDPKQLDAVAALRNQFANLPVLRYQLGQAVDNSPAAQLTVDFNPRYDDNSNTQFAILALWAAQKAGVPVDRNLAMVDARFRATQNVDGSWGYNNTTTRLWLDSMTCAGLLGLATGRGASKLNTEGGKAARGLTRDPQVQKALQFLSNTVGKPPIKGVAHTNGALGFRLFGSTAEEDIFFLWSLERMSVIYRLQTVGGKEWYPWGEKLLVDSQRADGSWLELYGSVPNTCFALLFLKRVNVAQDLTSKLQKLESVGP